MRCLYCGKELALLKRWTGGGEFCSDAHRQRYQEEYNQLALNRLLQAKPSADAKPLPEPQPVPAKSPLVPSEPVMEPTTYRAAPPSSPPPERPEPPVRSIFVPAPEPPSRIPVPPPAPTPVVFHPEPPPEVIAPASIAGFLVERPVVVLT